jgi:hypothetical protein
VPFLLFWCIGSFALGQEAARAPLLAVASSAVDVLSRAQALQTRAATAVRAAHISQVATGIATGGLGVKTPTVAFPTHRARHKRPVHVALRVRGSDGSPGMSFPGMSFPGMSFPGMGFPPAPWLAASAGAVPEALWSLDLGCVAAHPRDSVWLLPPAWAG